MKSNVAISTGWNSIKHENASEMIKEIQSLGISNMEAGYSMKQQQLDDLAGLLPGMDFRVNSVHNFCPIPPGHKCNWGDDFILSSPDDDLRREGVKYTLQTANLAGRLGARVVVVHLGKVEVDRKLHTDIKQLIHADKAGSDEFKFAVNEMKVTRKRLAGPHFDAARRTLDDVISKLPKGITLGIENRYEYYSMPIIDEMEKLLDEYGSSIGYWYDTGHGYVTEFMGFYEKGECIKRLGKSLIGMHIHDCAKISDHMAPGFGDIDFESFKPYMNGNTLKVLELHPRVTYDEAKKGVEYLKSKDII